MSTTLHLVWDRLTNCRRPGETDDLPFQLDRVEGAEHLYAVAHAIHVFTEDRIDANNFEVLAHPEGWFTVQGGAYGSGLWSLVAS